LVGAGILSSRIVGLVRQRALGHYFGASVTADAFMAALRIPNMLQNLFGEGVLSASFIPVYSRLLASGDEREARRVAGAVAGLLGVIVGLLVLGGIAAAPLLIDLVAPGFSGAQRQQTVDLVRIIFPGMGLLVLSAWCLGILNSHGLFFLSYAAPVVWNLAIISVLLVFGGSSDQPQLAIYTAWGAVAGSALQFLVQLPAVLRVARGVMPRLQRVTGQVATVVRNALPVFFGRGVLQVSAYIDTVIASLLPIGAVASLSYAQALYLLPVSLFGMAVSAAELPAMSRLTAGEPASGPLLDRLYRARRRIAFFVVPSAFALATMGDTIAALVYQSGRFTEQVAAWVWSILAGAALGLLATTLARLYSSVFYAVGDTATPLRFALVRVGLSVGLGFPLALAAPTMLGLDRIWGVAGITLAASVAGWVEWLLLRRAVRAKLGPGQPLGRLLAGLCAAAGLASLVAWGGRLLVSTLHPALAAIIVLGMFGTSYLAATRIAGVPESRLIADGLGHGS